MNISQLRKEYRLRNLPRKDLLNNPINQFQKWLKEAISSEVSEPNAMTLATANKNGKPSSRTVLLKQFDSNGMDFFTNSGSRKAVELFENPYASVTFLWKEIERQVTVEGKVIRTEREEEELYFSKRPRESQLGAWASRQDAIIASRQELEEAYSSYETQFHDQQVSTPPFWTGFRIIPSRFEFWQGRPNRLHDRFEYLQDNGNWIINRLSP